MKKKFRSFDDARKFARKKNLINRVEWTEYCKSGKKPNDIPANPDKIYKNKEWKGWGDWLGTGYVAHQKREYLPWSQAKIEYQKLAKKYGLKNYADWIKFSRSHKLPPGIPNQPWHIYTKEKVWRKMKK